ncbi:hypothetical protein EJ08DRAFT_693610 [Tothia fuscella]|uniref:Uncharacterized protein n=1 Tax=Tothia fuscella TaxID=1048955 RepID=A0A9P4P0G1_9PEZI|nr:hypothetical protein EJ08DRAFT_693610 [Tothia fuscella]
MLITRLRGRALFYLLAICFFTTIFFILTLNNKRVDFFDRTPLPTQSNPNPHPIYKPARNATAPILDNFPLAAKASSPDDLPPIPSFNRVPDPHVTENTPLFIGFTRNWPLLQQTVVSYITAGWPPSDIYVVENTGTMNANKLGKLTLQNPFYIDYNRLINIFGVNVVSTPTYLSFSQLQNFYLSHAIEKAWEYYFWGHMDVLALPEEEYTNPVTGNYTSLYMRTVEDLRRVMDPDYATDEDGSPVRWAIQFYAYDRLALVNRLAFEEVGGWDVQIPYYGTDCDMHERLFMAGFKQEESKTGLIYDIGSSLQDLLILYRRKPPINQGNSWTMSRTSPWGEEDELNSPAYQDLVRELDQMQVDKNSDARGRNTWQASQNGGKGEPYYRDPEGFEKAVHMTIEFGRKVMEEKWGHRGCALRGAGLTLGDEWRVEHDWND